MPQAQAEHSLTLADVLEDELQEICGDAPPRALPWEFDPAQVLRPQALRTRLLEGRDLVARALAAGELAALAEALRAPQDDAAISAAVAAAFNDLLERADLYREGDARFAAVRFRAATRERIEAGPIRERNRLILEDAFPEVLARDDARLGRAFARAHGHGLAALCLSGGGIRSATFALGVVQGLARAGALGRFHYLSTVSGGGYTGGWLSAWIRRVGIERVADELSRHSGRPLAPEPGPLSHLREFSRYLSPNLGLLSIDAWTLAATYLRNLLLNWLVLLPLLVAAVALPQFLIALARLPSRATGEASLLGDAGGLALLGTAVVGAAAAARYVHAHRPRRAADAAGSFAGRDSRAFLLECFGPKVAALASLAIFWAWVAAGKVSWLSLPGGPAAWEMSVAIGEWRATLPAAWVWAAAGAIVQLAGWLLALRRLVLREIPLVLVTGALGGLAGGLILHGLVPTAAPRSAERLAEYAWYVSFAVPALLSAALFLGHFFVGASSRMQGEALSEWNARYSAWLLIAIFVWLAACAISVLVPLGIAWTINEVGNADLVKLAQVAVSALGVGAGAVSLRLGYKAPLAPGAEVSLGARIAQALALPIFVVCLLAALSDLAGWLMDLPEALSPYFADLSCPEPGLPGSGRYYVVSLVWIVCGSVPSALVVLLALVLTGVVFSLLIDTNRFSLHGMYRSRLTRTFLGASRPGREREPERFTGFDERDDLPLAELRRQGQRAPLHVVNVALNLTSGEALASRERKAVSFTFSPLHSGAWRVGYRPTREYGGGVTLGTAITISGAAASPEMGYHSKPLHSFLLTLFNIRLGWWLGNPGFSGRRSYRNAAPASSVLPILEEALGRTDERNPNVYLSDGGHFENLGLYEMVLRRCRWIVVSDAGCDPQCTFEDLGNAIRRIRIDLGIPIAFDGMPICGRRQEAERKAGASYCAVGRIRYSAVDGEVEDGTLIYLKPAFYGSEPPDVFNYAHTSAAFPHEPTADQFFTEAQFESYRRLGVHVVESIESLLRAPACGPQAQAQVEARLRASSGTR